MKIFIFHGEDQAKSRQALYQSIDQAKQKGFQVKWLSGDSLTRADLEIQLGTQDLFTQEIIVIENFLSQPKSKNKDQCLNYLETYSGSKDLYFWDKKLVTATTLKKLKSHQPIIKVFKLPFLVYKLLESFLPNNSDQTLAIFHQTLNHADPNFIFIMLARHLSQLIIAKTAPNQLTGASWQKQKLIRQANQWSLTQLINFHHQLFQIDLHFKTGQSQLDLIDQLDLLFLSL